MTVWLLQTYSTIYSTVVIFGSRFREPAQEAVRGGESSQWRGHCSEGVVKGGEIVSTDPHHYRTPVLVDSHTHTVDKIPLTKGVALYIHWPVGVHVTCVLTCVMKHLVFLLYHHTQLLIAGCMAGMYTTPLTYFATVISPNMMGI